MMDPISQLRQNYSNLTKSEQKLADYILEDPRRLLSGNISQVAGHADSSNAALVRLSQKLGYNGFSEFRFSMNRYLLSHGADASPSSDLAKDPMQRMIDTYVQYMNQIPNFVRQDQLEQIARSICSARRIIIWGCNRTYQSAQQLSHRLCRLGIFNKCTDDWVVMSDDAEIMKEQDLCILLSIAGRGFAGRESLVTSLRKSGCQTLLITMNPKQSLAKEVNQMLVLPWISNDTSTNFFEDQIIMYMGLELLLAEVAKIYET